MEILLKICEVIAFISILCLAGYIKIMGNRYLYGEDGLFGPSKNDTLESEIKDITILRDRGVISEEQFEQIYENLINKYKDKK